MASARAELLLFWPPNDANGPTSERATGGMERKWLEPGSARRERPREPVARPAGKRAATCRLLLLGSPSGSLGAGFKFNRVQPASRRQLSFSLSPPARPRPLSWAGEPLGRLADLATVTLGPLSAAQLGAAQQSNNKPLVGHRRLNWIRLGPRRSGQHNGRAATSGRASGEERICGRLKCQAERPAKWNRLNSHSAPMLAAGSKALCRRQTAHLAAAEQISRISERNLPRKGHRGT